MYRIKISLGFTFLLLANISIAQNTGFIGKKNIFSFFTTSNFRVTPALTFVIDESGSLYRSNRYNKNNELKTRFDLFRVDYRFSYQRIISQKNAIGLEFGYEKSIVRLKQENEMFFYDDFGNIISSNSVNSVSDPVFNTYSIMLTMEFFKPSSLQGVGLSSSIGAGTKIYSFKFSENYRVTEELEIAAPFSTSDSKFFAINFHYQLTYRMLLTRSILFETGMRLHTGFVLPHGDFLYPATSSSAYWNKSNVYQNLFGANLFNLMSLKTGLVFIL